MAAYKADVKLLMICIKAFISLTSVKLAFSKIRNWSVPSSAPAAGMENEYAGNVLLSDLKSGIQPQDLVDLVYLVTTTKYNAKNSCSLVGVLIANPSRRLS